MVVFFHIADYNILSGSMKYINQRNFKDTGLCKVSFTLLQHVVGLLFVLDYSDVTLNLCVQHIFSTFNLGQCCSCCHRNGGLAGRYYTDLL